jgi:hypothetical protein
LKLANASEEVAKRERDRVEREQLERQREREELQSKIELMMREREELALQLKSTEEVAKQREQMMAENLAKEKVREHLDRIQCHSCSRYGYYNIHRFCYHTTFYFMFIVLLYLPVHSPTTTTSPYVPCLFRRSYD